MRSCASSMSQFCGSEQAERRTPAPRPPSQAQQQSIDLDLLAAANDGGHREDGVKLAAEPTALDTAAALVLTYSEYTGFTPEELVEGLIALHLTPPEPLRSHLERTALRESKLPGVPVGAFLVHRSRASALCAAVGALGQRTFLCAPLCWPEADDDWLVLRARAATASALAADAESVRRIEASCGAI